MSRTEEEGARRAHPQPMAREKTQRFLGEFAERHRSRLIKRLQRTGETQQDAQDLANEALMRLVREFRSEESPPSEQRCVSFLSTTLTNLYTDHLRKRRTQRKALPKLRLASSLAAEPDEVQPPEEDTRQREQLAQAMQELSPTTRAALKLDAEGKSGREITQVLGGTEGAARKRVHDAKKRITAWIQRWRARGGH